MIGSSLNRGIARAIKCIGSQVKLADAIGCGQSTLSNYLLNKKKCSAKVAIAIEQATGVPRHAIRPDLFPPQAK